MTLASILRQWFGKGGTSERAQQVWREGRALLDAGEGERARGCFEQALADSPHNAEWQNELGLLCAGLGDAASALEHFRLSARLNPDLASAQYNSGLQLWKLGRPDEALVHFERARALMPGSVDVLRDRACVLQELGRLQEAEQEFSKVLALAPDYADARLSLAFVRLLRGEFASGWQDYEARYLTDESPRRDFPCPDWLGESIAQARLLVYAEQGLGDELLFASCVPDLIARCRHLLIDCEPRLARLFARSFPAATVHGGARNEEFSWLAKLAPDRKIAAGSVPGFLRNEAGDFPAGDHYLVADPARAAHWRQRLDQDFSASGGVRRPRVGIAWRGGLAQTGNLQRSLQLADLLPALQGVDLVSLQRDAAAAELASAREQGAPIRHWPEAHIDLDETAALIMSLDLIITACCSTVHLAGGLGKPTWVLVPFAPDWRFGAGGEGMPWHRSVRLFRQKKRGDWSGALTAVGDELASRSGAAGIPKAPGYPARPTPRSRRELEWRIDQQPDDAAAYCELGELAMAEGESEAALDSFELALHYRPDYVDALLGHSRVLRASGQAAAAEVSSRAAVKLSPSSLAARMELAASLKAQGRMADAIAEYRAALENNPDEPALLCNLGFALHVGGDYAAAEQSLRRALAVQPEFAEAHHNLGLVLRESGDIDAAIAEFHLALKQGQLIASRSALAHAQRDAGRIEEALANYDAVLAGQPAYGDALLNRGYALLMRGDDAQDDYTRGWEAYGQRFAAGEFAERDFGLPEWQSHAQGSGSGKGVLVFGEQGLGDEIMFASCLPDLLKSGQDYAIECNSRLAPLFARSFDVPVHGGAKTDATDWVRAHSELAWQIPIGGLPRLYRRSTAAFTRRDTAYLRADPERVAEWKRRLAITDGTRGVGLSWRGGSRQTRGGLRSIALAQLAPLFAVAGAQFVSLQHGEIADELTQLQNASGAHLPAWRGTGDDLDELAAMISALDLVITIDNTVAHLAGALGKPVWILLPQGAEWRYGLKAESMPWYPQARLFRKTGNTSWDAVVEDVAAALKNGEGL